MRTSEEENDSRLQRSRKTRAKRNNTKHAHTHAQTYFTSHPITILACVRSFQNLRTRGAAGLPDQIVGFFFLPSLAEKSAFQNLGCRPPKEPFNIFPSFPQIKKIIIIIITNHGARSNHAISIDIIKARIRHARRGKQRCTYRTIYNTFLFLKIASIIFGLEFRPPVDLKIQNWKLVFSLVYF